MRVRCFCLPAVLMDIYDGMLTIWHFSIVLACELWNIVLYLFSGHGYGANTIWQLRYDGPEA
jgi:hypothetical protein